MNWGSHYWIGRWKNQIDPTALPCHNLNRTNTSPVDFQFCRLLIIFCSFFKLATATSDGILNFGGACYPGGQMALCPAEQCCGETCNKRCYFKRRRLLIPLVKVDLKVVHQRKSHKGQGAGWLVSIVSDSHLSLMIIALATQFHVYLPCGQCGLA